MACVSLAAMGADRNSLAGRTVRRRSGIKGVGDLLWGAGWQTKLHRRGLRRA